MARAMGVAVAVDSTRAQRSTRTRGAGRGRPQPLRADDARWSRSIRAAAPAWLLARVIVVTVGLVAAHGDGSSPLHVWDADWYYKLGVHGYAPYGSEGVRFFPLLPTIVSVGFWLGLPAKAWLVAVCWVAALFFAAAVHRLTLLETGDDASARRAAWLVQLVPGASLLAIGYTEALAGMLAALYFLAIRHGLRHRAGLLVGALSGLVRPTGPVLALPGAVEAVRSALRGRGDRSTAIDVKRLLRSMALTVAPLVGTAAYLGWAWYAFGDPLTPYRVQAAGELRGGVMRAPWEYLTHTSAGGYDWRFVLALLVVAVVALVLCARLLPLSYAAWSLPMVLLAATAWGLHSLPRYLAAVFPLWMVVAIVCRPRFVWWGVLLASTVGFTWVAYLTVTPAGPVP